MIRPKEKKERFLGERLGLRGERGASPKAAIIRKPYPPGQHGPNKKPKKLSEYARQLREKQKFKLSYGISETSLRRFFEEAHTHRTPTAQKLLELLERRLDNVLFRLGLAPSRAAARELIRHGHILLNGHRARAGSTVVKIKDVISFPESSKAKSRILKENKEVLKRQDVPSWLRLDTEVLRGEVLDLPRDVEPPFDMSLLVQTFSK